ncbi:MAG: carboxypeptidase regulatory-like domain-containing protein, partial [Acidobacteria bacterium]|nr:carboxypeptidase regulatory-like domain-containing protein [Acidobacteriota bacterium]
MLGYPGALAACAVALVVAVPAAAQESINHASVSGRVSDSQGAVVPGATVTARQVETDVSSSVVSDAGGRFRFAYLRVGTYDLSVQLIGFAEVRRRITVSIGAAFEIPIVLAVEG